MGLDPKPMWNCRQFQRTQHFLRKSLKVVVCVVLRVHRPGYHTQQEIESELAWIIVYAERESLKLRALAVKGGNI